MLNVQVVIVTYFPDLKVVSVNINELLKDASISTIYIVDNTPSPCDISLLSSERVLVHVLGENKGIASAQNIGIKLALAAGANYVVLFDQDSILQSDLVSGLLSTMQEAQADKINLACIGPRSFDVFSRKETKPLIQSEKTISSALTICPQIIASGQLIDANVLNVVGLMEESLFIDAVDHEWCWRARKHGFQVAIAEEVVMEHTLGDARGRFIGVQYKIDSPIRMYYQFRNILVLVRRDYVPLYWKLRCIVSIFFRFIIFGLIRKDASIRRKYMWEGIVDGIKKRTGSYASR
ncbi:glycosyltransferase family 2 protein [Psychromonas sp. PT13]|uniref:glycosyltransferase family 2 protein n=1 Tax=Psychromonas sp. PT13 TaxID=3439547 RepID=UPI003EB949C1